jgi:hypothetical protein
MDFGVSLSSMSSALSSSSSEEDEIVTLATNKNNFNFDQAISENVEPNIRTNGQEVGKISPVSKNGLKFSDTCTSNNSDSYFGKLMDETKNSSYRSITPPKELQGKMFNMSWSEPRRNSNTKVQHHRYASNTIVATNGMVYHVEPFQLPPPGEIAELFNDLKTPGGKHLKMRTESDLSSTTSAVENRQDNNRNGISIYGNNNNQKKHHDDNSSMLRKRRKSFEMNNIGWSESFDKNPRKKVSIITPDKRKLKNINI